MEQRVCEEEEKACRFPMGWSKGWCPTGLLLVLWLDEGYEGYEGYEKELVRLRETRCHGRLGRGRLDCGRMLVRELGLCV